VKSAPPKETARITVKPNLPATAVRAGGNFPTAKPAAGATPVAVAAAAGAVAGAVAAKAVAKPSGGSKPATTIVKAGTGTAKVVAAPRPVAASTSASGGVPVPEMPATQYQEEGSTMVTTVLAGVLAFVTWGTAGVLFASYFGMI
jgi:hypothetical protein